MKPKTHKISALETLFARIFRIVEGKEYLVNIHWGARRNSFSRPLHLSLIRIVMGTAAVVLLGLACLSFEVGRWGVTELRYRFAQTSHHRYVNRLQGVQTSFSSFETTLDTIFRQEQKMRALYGINYLGSGYGSFGVGGRTHLSETDLDLSSGLYQTLFKDMLKSHQLRGKMDFTLKNLRQISEFVTYRSNLWDHTPSVAPARGEWTSPFGYRVNPVTGQYVLHAGLDIAGNRWTPIYSPADGIVNTAEPSEDYGNMIILDHGNGFHTKFAHLQRILVEKGQLVKRYTLLGYMGSTGRATGVHVHYEVVRDGSLQNPERFILPPGLMVD